MESIKIGSFCNLVKRKTKCMKLKCVKVKDKAQIIMLS